MNQFKEMMGSVFLVNSKNEILYEVTKPAMLFDQELFVVHTIGNQQEVLQYYEASIAKCAQQQSDLFESWVVMDLPLDASLLDRILQRTGSLERIIKDELQVKLDF